MNKTTEEPLLINIKLSNMDQIALYDLIKWDLQLYVPTASSVHEDSDIVYDLAKSVRSIQRKLIHNDNVLTLSNIKETLALYTTIKHFLNSNMTLQRDLHPLSYLADHISPLALINHYHDPKHKFESTYIRFSKVSPKIDKTLCEAFDSVLIKKDHISTLACNDANLATKCRHKFGANNVFTRRVIARAIKEHHQAENVGNAFNYFLHI